MVEKKHTRDMLGRSGLISVADALDILLKSSAGH